MASPEEDRAATARAERRAQILAAAKEVFAEAGYHEASINAIIERAGIARGTFYLYFTSKAAVFDALLDEAMGALRKRITPSTSPKNAPSRFAASASGAFAPESRIVASSRSLST